MRTDEDIPALKCQETHKLIEDSVQSKPTLHLKNEIKDVPEQVPTVEQKYDLVVKDQKEDFEESLPQRFLNGQEPEDSMMDMVSLKSSQT